jgi:hypothetical protein
MSDALSGIADLRDDDIDALGALEVVAKVGWLSKGAWDVSRAVHAFAKPIMVTLTPL